MNRPTNSSPACVLALLLLPAGCISNSYELELIPGDDGVERKLVATQRGGAAENGNGNAPRSIDRKELKQIFDAYEDATDFKSEDNQHFSGKFAGKTPQDIGGSGRFAKWSTSLGTYHVYSERFRGNDDLIGELESRRKSGDLLISWIADFAKQQTIDIEGQDRLLKFIEADLRRDLHNLAAYAMTLQVAASQAKESSVAEEWAMRLIQYFVERGYLVPSDTPVLLRAIRDGNHNDGNRIMNFVQRVVARKLGVADDAPIPAVLSFLGEPKQLFANFDEYMRKTGAYFSALREWNELDDDSEQPTGVSVAGTMLMKATANTLIFGSNDDLKLKLATQVPPFATNGKWDGAMERVKWDQSLARRDDKAWQWPVLCFAHWSIPDRDQQVSTFGSVILRDQELAEYCLWYHGLSEEEAKDWDGQLARLKPTTWKDAVNGFRFSQRNETTDGLAQLIRKLLTKSED